MRLKKYNFQNHPYKNIKIPNPSRTCLTGRGGAAGAKFRISLACPVGAVMNCADNTGNGNDDDDDDADD